MTKEYQSFVRNPENLPEGQEIELTIKALTPGRQKYDARIVKAIVSSSPDKLPGGDILWLRSLVGVLHPQPWAIKIMQELGEYMHSPPYTDLS